MIHEYSSSHCSVHGVTHEYSSSHCSVNGVTHEYSSSHCSVNGLTHEYSSSQCSVNGVTHTFNFVETIGLNSINDDFLHDDTAEVIQMGVFKGINQLSFL